MDYIEKNRDFKGVWIPKEIWLNENLTMLEKVILTEIDSLDNEEHCVAGNDYLAQFCQCSIPKVTQAIKKLTDLGYIEVVSFDGRHRRLRSCIIKNMSLKNYDSESGEVLGSIIKSIRQPNKKYEAESGKVLAINIDNNLDNNLVINNNAETSSANQSSSETKYTNEIKQIIDYLNLKADTKYRASSDNTKKHITARLNQEYTVDDFKHVIDVKCAEWLNTEMEKFLRPETLFGSKFENYLNQKITEPKKDNRHTTTGHFADPANIIDEVF